jgi:uncharacterized peroxidase-related enzyme
MAWIRTVDESAATGRLKERYQEDLDKLGFVMAATKAFSASPTLAEAYRVFRHAIQTEGRLSLRERRLINLVVADRIRSTYCVLVYGTALERELGGAAGLKAVLTDYQSAGLSEREVAILDYALAVTVGDERREHVERLRGLELDDTAVLAVAFTAAFRLLGSRLYSALGVETDPFFLEQQDLMEALPAHHKETACR